MISQFQNHITTPDSHQSAIQSLFCLPVLSAACSRVHHGCTSENDRHQGGGVPGPRDGECDRRSIWRGRCYLHLVCHFPHRRQEPGGDVGSSL